MSVTTWGSVDGTLVRKHVAQYQTQIYNSTPNKKVAVDNNNSFKAGAG